MKKSCLTVLILTLTALLLTACGARPKQALTSGEVNSENVAQVCDVLRDAGLSHVDVFEQWVRSSAAPDASASGFTDADCRMTVMLLAGEQIRAESVEPSYEGTYLMFDVDAIENQPEFEILRDKKSLFTTMFGDPFLVTVVQDEAELLQVLSQRPDYSVQEGEAAPVVCKNAEQIGALSPALS